MFTKDDFQLIPNPCQMPLGSLVEGDPQGLWATLIYELGDDTYGLEIEIGEDGTAFVQALRALGDDGDMPALVKVRVHDGFDRAQVDRARELLTR
jgi:hypothetical protein